MSVVHKKATQIPAFSDFIRSFDLFGYSFTWQFKGNESNQTFIGGIVSIMINMLIIWQTYFRMGLMINYSRDVILDTDSMIDFKQLGDVNFDRLGGQIPYYGITGDEWFPRESAERCNGDCFKYFQENLNITWQAMSQPT